MTTSQLIFVYNAHSGVFNAMLGTAHKLLSPESYSCDLCALTFGAFKEKEAWIRFRESVQIPFSFLHKDEFLKAYRSKWLPKYDFPLVLAEREGSLEIVISAETLSETATIEELITLVQKVLACD